MPPPAPPAAFRDRGGGAGAVAVVGGANRSRGAAGRKTLSSFGLKGACSRAKLFHGSNVIGRFSPRDKNCPNKIQLGIPQKCNFVSRNAAELHVTTDGQIRIWKLPHNPSPVTILRGHGVIKLKEPDQEGHILNLSVGDRICLGAQFEFELYESGAPSKTLAPSSGSGGTLRQVPPVPPTGEAAQRPQPTSVIDLTSDRLPSALRAKRKVADVISLSSDSSDDLRTPQRSSPVRKKLTSMSSASVARVTLSSAAGRSGLTCKVEKVPAASKAGSPGASSQRPVTKSGSLASAAGASLLPEKEALLSLSASPPRPRPSPTRRKVKVLRPCKMEGSATGTSDAAARLSPEKQKLAARSSSLPKRPNSISRETQSSAAGPGSKETASPYKKQSRILSPSSSQSSNSIRQPPVPSQKTASPIHVSSCQRESSPASSTKVKMEISASKVLKAEKMSPAVLVVSPRAPRPAQQKRTLHASGDDSVRSSVKTVSAPKQPSEGKSLIARGNLAAGKTLQALRPGQRVRVKVGGSGEWSVATLVKCNATKSIAAVVLDDEASSVDTLEAVPKISDVPLACVSALQGAPSLPPATDDEAAGMTLSWARCLAHLKLYSHLQGFAFLVSKWKGYGIRRVIIGSWNNNKSVFENCICDGRGYPFSIGEILRCLHKHRSDVPEAEDPKGPALPTGRAPCRLRASAEPRKCDTCSKEFRREDRKSIQNHRLQCCLERGRKSCSDAGVELMVASTMNTLNVEQLSCEVTAVASNFSFETVGSKKCLTPEKMTDMLKSMRGSTYQQHVETIADMIQVSREQFRGLLQPVEWDFFLGVMESLGVPQPVVTLRALTAVLQAIADAISDSRSSGCPSVTPLLICCSMDLEEALRRMLVLAVSAWKQQWLAEDDRRESLGAEETVAATGAACAIVRVSVVLAESICLSSEGSLHPSTAASLMRDSIACEVLSRESLGAMLRQGPLLRSRIGCELAKLLLNDIREGSMHQLLTRIKMRFSGKGWAAGSAPPQRNATAMLLGDI
jgi:hypothetical protein